MNIEKLGITPIDLNDYENVDHVIEEPIRKVEQQRNEMLEALIDEAIYYEDSYQTVRASFLIRIIENACYPKTWEEIKELTNE